MGSIESNELNKMIFIKTKLFEQSVLCNNTHIIPVTLFYSTVNKQKNMSFSPKLKPSLGLVFEERCIVKRTKVTAQWMKEFETHTRLLISHFDWRFVCSIHLIYLKYSGVLFNSHFQPTPFLYPPNTPSLTLLICCSLSLSLRSLSTLFSPVAIWLNTPKFL